MAPLRVGWHREHFLSPLLQLAEKDAGSSFELVECPGGTGDMQVKLRDGQIDICIALTDALIAGLANGQNAYRLVGRYISSPLRWAVITGKGSDYDSIDDLKGTTFGISRLGSGSQVMASVLGLQQGWSAEEQPKFAVNGQFKPLRDSVNDGSTSCFLWEWFTTKPFVDSGEVRFIGYVDTPWPCWSIAAARTSDPAATSAFLSALEPYVKAFNSAEAREKDDIDFVTGYFGHRPEDVKEWLATVRWYEDIQVVEEKVIRDTLGCVMLWLVGNLRLMQGGLLEKAGVVKAPTDGASWDMSTFVSEGTKLV